MQWELLDIKDETSGERLIEPDFIPTCRRIEVQLAELEAIFEKECDKLKDIVKKYQ